MMWWSFAFMCSAALLIRANPSTHHDNLILSEEDETDVSVPISLSEKVKTGTGDLFSLVSESGDPLVVVNGTEDGQELRFNYYRDWLGNMPNSISLGDIAFPGTHDTMARYGGPSAEAQDLSLSDQLNYGIRTLDIRCRHTNGVCAIHHGPYFQQAFLGDVLNTITGFLSSYPTEVILMRVKQEGNVQNDPGLEQTIADKFADPYYARFIWNGGDTVPTLGQVRGKIVVLDQVSSNGRFGPRWFRCGSCSDACTTPCIQDEYKAGTSTKWDHIYDHLQRTNRGTSSNLYFNFISTTGILTIKDFARILNMKFVEHMRVASMNYNRIGSIMMDFPNAEQIMLIISHNFHSVSVNAQFYEHMHLGGETKTFTIQPNTCINFGHWDKRASSLYVHGDQCVRLWDGCGCTGNNINMRNSDDCAYSLPRCNWNDRARSISRC